MKEKKYIALGLMSGTSMDGVDASIISSIDGNHYDEEFNSFYEYEQDLRLKITVLRDKLTNLEKLRTLSKELKSLEKQITLFHARVVNDFLHLADKAGAPDPKIIGFHGQTMFHSPEEKISLQLGDGSLLSQLTKKTVVYDFRKNDLKNGGQGAPLAPVFHNSMISKMYRKKKIPLIVLNIGGITNATGFPYGQSNFNEEFTMFAGDIGPGNCLIDEWMRKKSKHKYDKDGLIAKSGKINELILNQALDNFSINYKNSLDIKDFDISFVRSLSLEDGAATLTKFTATVIKQGLTHLIEKKKYKKELCSPPIIVCGGGRKNKHLMNLLNNMIFPGDVFSIDKKGINGDFVESQAFAFLAIRKYLDLPISFPNTTGCKNLITGGVIAKNF